MEIMEGSYEELTIELKSGDNKGLTRERRRGKSSLSKRPEIHREEPACGPKRNATPKFCMKFAAHKMRIFQTSSSQRGDHLNRQAIFFSRIGKAINVLIGNLSKLSLTCTSRKFQTQEQMNWDPGKYEVLSSVFLVCSLFPINMHGLCTTQLGYKLHDLSYYIKTLGFTEKDKKQDNVNL